MNPDSQPQQTPVQPPPAWYVEANGGVAPPPQPSKSHKWLFVAAWLVAAIIVIGGGVLLILDRMAVKCLTTDDYHTITGVVYQDSFSPTDNFYTGSVSFKAKSSEYTTDDQLRIIQNLGQFQSSHPNVSLKITLSTSFTPDEGKDLAIKRLGRLKESFIQAGAKEDTISLQEPLGYTPESDITVTSSPLHYQVTSSSECK